MINPILSERMLSMAGRQLRSANAAGCEVQRGTRKRGNSNKRVSNAKLRGLGWSLRYPTFPEAMEKSILPSRDLRAKQIGMEAAQYAAMRSIKLTGREVIGRSRDRIHRGRCWARRFRIIPKWNWMT